MSIRRDRAEGGVAALCVRPPAHACVCKRGVSPALVAGPRACWGLCIHVDPVYNAAGAIMFTGWEDHKASVMSAGRCSVVQQVKPR